MLRERGSSLHKAISGEFPGLTAQRQLVRRSVPGALLYFVAFLLTVFITPHIGDRPWFVALSGTLILLIGSVRLVAALSLRDATDERLRKWIRPFRYIIYVQFGTWGLFCAATVFFYGLIPPVFMMLLFSVALASGASTALASEYKVGRVAICLMLAPTIVAALALRATLADVLALVTVLFLAYLMVQIKEHWTSGVEANRAAVLKASRESEERAAARRQQMTNVVLSLWRTAAGQRGALQESLQEVARTAAETIAVERVNIWEPTEDRKKIRCLVAYERSAARFSSGMELEFAAYPTYFRHLDAHRTIAADDARTDPRTLELADGYVIPNQITSMMDSAVRLEGGQLGVICHEHVGQPRRWSPEDQDFASSIGDLVAMIITQARQAEADEQRLQAQKLEALGVLAGGIAHDFNNILAVINGFAELALLDIPQGSRNRNHLEQILRAGGRAADLVRQILAFSSRGDQPEQIVNVRTVVDEVMILLRASIPASIEIVATVKQDGYVLASVIELQQILINLCTNSYHAMEKSGRIEIGIDVIDTTSTTLRPGLTLAKGQYVCISVSDTGRGIDPEVRERIFDPFFTTKPVGRGTGLGLAVVHGIVRRYKGAVDVTSTPGQGACFSIYLPRSEAPAPQLEEPATSVNQGHERILFVDDEDALVSLWKEILEKNGYTVTCARNGQEALGIFQANPDAFHLVITDVTMPKMSGPDLAKSILDLRPDMPIIMSTGYAHNMITGQFRNIGIREMLAKPCPPNRLLTAVRNALDS